MCTHSHCLNTDTETTYYLSRRNKKQILQFAPGSVFTLQYAEMFHGQVWRSQGEKC